MQRAGQRPLRELVAERQTEAAAQRFGTAREDMGAMHQRSDQRETLFPPERAMASQGWGEQRTPDLAESGPGEGAVGRAAGRDAKPKS